MEVTETKTISFESGYAILTLEDLSKTIRLELATGGLPKNRPIEHFQLIENIQRKTQDAINQSIVKTETESNDPHLPEDLTASDQLVTTPEPSYSVGIEPIYISEKHAKRMLWIGEKDKCPIDKYHIERVVTRIIIRDSKNETLDQAIAISYTENGISVAIGVNVRTCCNMNIFGSNIVSTYGPNRVPYDKLWEIICLWSQNLFSIWKSDIEVIQRLQSIQMDRKITDELIGRLIRKAVLQNHGEKMNSPMNVTQVCRFIEQGAEILSKEDFTNFTAWSFTNHMTAVLKPDTADMGTLWQSNFLVNQFVTDAFGIPYNNPNVK